MDCLSLVAISDWPEQMLEKVSVYLEGNSMTSNIARLFTLVLENVNSKRVLKAVAKHWFYGYEHYKSLSYDL